MRKILKYLLFFCPILVLVSCNHYKKDVISENQSSIESQKQETVTIEDLKIQFFPSKDLEMVNQKTEPLENLLKEEFKKEGYDVKKVSITIATSYEAVGEALASGTGDIGFVPSGTYVLFENDLDLLLTATRAGFNVDSDDVKVWNESVPIKRDDSKKVSFYRGEILLGNSEKANLLKEKIDKGEDITWDDLDNLSWSVMNPSSASGYIYPSIYLNEHYGKTLSDLSNATKSDSYASSFARLAAGQVDCLTCYTEARIDYEAKWKDEWTDNKSIWDDTKLFALSDKIYNDTICASKKSPVVDQRFEESVRRIFMNIAKTDVGREIISVYNHTGYTKGDPKNYEKERKAQEFIKSLNNE